ncbi:MAG: enoyl-[acyl-carrier-protein] reductase FabK [Peptostreptococcaceae bacterium]|nr:enoyl-[acyl-carrier-protein] reductase FabK [Peptostreptococcaceae bacterium]
MMETAVSKLLGIEYPILQGAMAWISDHQLVSAVSEAGGLGILAGGNAPGDWVREQIRRIKEKTDKPFGVNIMLLSPYADELADIVLEEKVPVVVTGAGNPGKYMEKWKKAGVIVLPVVPSIALAKRMERLGADALIAEGSEAGGHIGELGTMTLVPQIVDAVHIPVIAAGGIADGRGVVAAFALGASAVQIGTRFLVAEECSVHEAYKKKVIDAKEIDTQVTGRTTGHPVRILRNKLARQFKEAEKSGAAPEEIEKMGEGTLYRAAKLGDVEYGSVMAGQAAGLVKKEQPCREIILELIEEANQIMANFNG